MLDGMEMGWRDTLVLMPGPDGVCSVYWGAGGGAGGGGDGGDDGSGDSFDGSR